MSEITAIVLGVALAIWAAAAIDAWIDRKYHR